MFAAHLRLGEFIGLNANDFNRKTGQLRVERQLTALDHTTKTKTGVGKTVRLLWNGITAASGLPMGIGIMPMVPGASNDRMPRQSLQRRLTQAVEDAEFVNFHIHDIRHIGLSTIAETGVPMKDVMARGGRASVQSAMRYQHTNADRDPEVVRKAELLMG